MAHKTTLGSLDLFQYFACCKCEPLDQKDSEVGFKSVQAKGLWSSHKDGSPHELSDEAELAAFCEMLDRQEHKAKGSTPRDSKDKLDDMSLAIKNLPSFKMKCAILTILAGTAAAFAPSSTAPQNSLALHAAYENELGAQKPLGYWDPIGLLKDADQERFDRLRYVELKHGRVAMLAFLGQITTRSGMRLPGAIDYAGTTFKSIPEGLKGLLATPSEGLTQIILFCGFLELFVMKDVTGTGEFKGDFRNKSLDFGWDIYFDEEKKLQKRGIELSNGRAAMMGILGLMVHEQLGTTMPIVGQM